MTLVALIHRFRGMGHVAIAYRRRALVFCLFCRFLFVNGVTDFGNVVVIKIVEQCEVGKTPIPLCSGELMLSLDTLKNNPGGMIRGCPHLLQVIY